MSDPFSIHFDHVRRRLTVTLGRSLSLAEAERYEQEITRTLAAVCEANRPFDALLDSSRCAVLPQDVLAPLGRVATLAVSSGARRVALVSASTLKAMQTRRMAQQVEIFQTFGDVADAVAWLDSERDAGRPLTAR